jgi:hypothetical protein
VRKTSGGMTTADGESPFGIGVTIIEPGVTATNFGAAMVTAPATEVYEQSTVGSSDGR